MGRFLGEDSMAGQFERMQAERLLRSDVLFLAPICCESIGEKAVRKSDNCKGGRTVGLE